MNSSLGQLYPFPTFPDSVRRDTFFAAFLTVFLLVFRPFGLEVYPYSQSYIIVGYGIITLLTTLANDCAAHHFFAQRFSERHWRVSSQILWTVWHLLSLGITNFLYAASIDAFPWSLVGFLKVQLYVVLSAIVPITVFILLRQNYLLKRNLAEAGQIAGRKPERSPHTLTLDFTVSGFAGQLRAGRVAGAGTAAQTYVAQYSGPLRRAAGGVPYLFSLSPGLHRQPRAGA